MTSAAMKKFTPHEKYLVHRHGSLQAHAGDRIRETAGWGGPTDPAHRHVRAEGPRLGRDAGPDDRGLDPRLERRERGVLVDPGPDHAGAAERREDSGGTDREVEAGRLRGGGRDLPRERRLETPVHLADEAEREVQLLDAHRTDAFKGAQDLRGACDALADAGREAHGHEEPRPRRSRIISSGAGQDAAPADPTTAAMILLIDNYDSFAFNLARYLEELGETVRVRRNDTVDPAALPGEGLSHIVISPGPGTPAEAGASVDVIRAAGAEIPILGVCLGHQCIAAAVGGRVVRAARPMHGRLSAVRHTGRGLFAGLPSPLDVTRYHSLVIDPADPGPGLLVTAETEAGEVMAVEHAAWPVWGVQFHPEAVLTAGGHRLLANFLALGRGEVPPAEPVEAERCPELPPGAIPPGRAPAGVS